MAMVVFSASGYGTDTHFYKGRKEAADAIECEIQRMAAEHGCDLKKNVSRWADEWVLNSPSGEEIARWELFDKWFKNLLAIMETLRHYVTQKKGGWSSR